MNGMKKLVVASMLSLGFASSALAANVNLGYGVSDFDLNPGVGAFSDTFTFVLTGLSSIDFSVTKQTQSLLVPGVGTYNIFNFQSGQAGFNYGLYSGATKIFDSSSLTAGTYTLKVAGITNGLFGGSYNLYANVALLPVPEPETNLMMMMGLIAIGSVVYRKKKSA